MLIIIISYLSSSTLRTQADRFSKHGGERAVIIHEPQVILENVTCLRGIRFIGAGHSHQISLSKDFVYSDVTVIFIIHHSTDFVFAIVGC